MGLGKPLEALRTFISSLCVVFKLIYLFWTNTNPENSRKEDAQFFEEGKLLLFDHFQLGFLVNLDHYWTTTRYELVLHIPNFKMAFESLDLLSIEVVISSGS